MTTQVARPRVRIIHETNPKKYFPAIFYLADRGDIQLVGSHRHSVLREWFRSWLRARMPLRHRTAIAWDALRLRLRLCCLQGEIVVIGMPPWDWRVLPYSHLTRRNEVIYHNSWPYWQEARAPRHYGPLTPCLRKAWARFLMDDRVKVVSVVPQSAQSIEDRFGIESLVIPHAVPDAFFAASRQRMSPAKTAPLRLVYVGELSEKKGVGWLLRAVPDLAALGARLTIVGDGPLRGACEAAAALPGVTYIGQLHDRADLASLLAGQDVLVLRSQRREDWEELFGIVIVEAMASGLGVITSDHIGPLSILANGPTDGIIGESDHADAFDLIRRLHEDHRYRDLFKAAHRDTADRYAIGTVAADWLAALHPVASGT